MVMIVGNVEDERCLPNMGFMKRKLRNRSTIHWDMVIKMFAQKFFTLNIFPFVATMSFWTIAKFRHGVKG
jgi:hypothetical protein